MQIAIFLLLALAGFQGADSKLDVGLDKFEGKAPIFVRMDDQIFRKAGDFEAFCQNSGLKKRSENRKWVLGELMQRSDNSWKSVQSVAETLESKGNIASVQRFWIVNGFACDADAEACKRLAEIPTVGFVYRQTGPPNLLQHRKAKAGAEVQAQREAAMKAMESKWTSDDSQPFSAAGFEVPWNLKQVQADQVWEKENVAGNGVVIALNDGGVDDLVCLEKSLWKNPKETINGKDDDGNGYVDDLFGWDGHGQHGMVLGNSGVFHGSMCAGIMVGRPHDERKIITGVAPRARLMVINGMGYLAGMEYAFANGADVFSMSYMFVNVEMGNYRGVYRLAAEHMTAGGVFLCGGAGNFAKSAPEGKQITIPKDIPCVMAMAGTFEDLSRPEFSSKGPVMWEGVKYYSDYPSTAPLKKPDAGAPAGGFPCWLMEKEARSNWKIVYQGERGTALAVGPQGNSFAGPHAAGVAALMFSANREINAWQVKQILENTAKDLDERGRDVLRGAGLIQALDAVRKAKAEGKS